MGMYRKRPVEIEALQFDGSVESANQILGWIGQCGGEGRRFHRSKPEQGILIVTLEGEMLASPGDYVIREPFPTSDRTFYPCKPTIFEATYEPVLAAPSQRTDDEPCPKCGGDRLRTDFTGSGRCHAPRSNFSITA